MQRIFSRGTLRQFWEKHNDSEQYLKTWFTIAMYSDWKNPSDVKQTFVNASILKNNRVVFNIKGNKYRLIVKINFEKHWVFIRFIGTHKAYEKINANTI